MQDGLLKACDSVAGIRSVLLDTTGYVVFTNGLTIQWGFIQGSESGEVDITYPLEFTQYYAVTASTAGTSNYSLYAKSNTGFGIHCTSANTGTYIAIGYIEQ